MASNMYREVDGMYLSLGFSEEVVRSALAYKPRQDDVFIVSYPKCGTTWMQHIVYYIFNEGKPPKDQRHFLAQTPFLEFVGVEGAIYLSRPAAIKTHMPFHLQPFSDQSKYIYITRNPFDCCVSFYYHTKHLPEYRFEDGTFDEFFEFFLKGQVDFGDYFTHLLSWYEERNRPNIMFVTYEDLKKDTRVWIQKVADFLGDEYGRRLREHPDLLERILELTGVKHMKGWVNDLMGNVLPQVCSTPVDSLPPCLVNIAKCANNDLKKPMTGDFVRKGEVGDWKNHFSPDQTKRMKEWIAKRTVGSDIMDLWKDMNLE
ncbi:sulfotransferase 1C2-like isoform X2 [Ornithodoros turicata]